MLSVQKWQVLRTTATTVGTPAFVLTCQAAGSTAPVRSSTAPAGERRGRRSSFWRRTALASRHVAMAMTFVTTSSLRAMSVADEFDVAAVDAGALFLRRGLFVIAVAAGRRRVVLAEETPVLLRRRPARRVVAVIPRVVVAERGLEVARPLGIARGARLRRDEDGRNRQDEGEEQRNLLSHGRNVSSVLPSA